MKRLEGIILRPFWLKKTWRKKTSDSIRSEPHVEVNRQQDFPIILETNVPDVMSDVNPESAVQDASISEITLEEEKFLESISGTNPFVTNDGRKTEAAQDTPGDEVFFTPRKPPPPKSGIPIFRSGTKKVQKDKVTVLPQQKSSEIQSKSKIPTPKASPRNIKPAPAPISIPKIKPRTWTVPTPPLKRFGPKQPEDIVIVDDCIDLPLQLPVKPAVKARSGYLQIHLEDFPKIRSKTLQKSSSHQNCNP